ncbi:unnamed protein product [Linum trigynum]|uniref:Uncharacterized protein n=1 Tax=Linum trigynum TaxID=586398 RepID=A0AAV2E168_9ROSI
MATRNDGEENLGEVCSVVGGSRLNEDSLQIEDGSDTSDARVPGTIKTDNSLTVRVSVAVKVRPENPRMRWNTRDVVSHGQHVFADKKIDLCRLRERNRGRWDCWGYWEGVC